MRKFIWVLSSGLLAALLLAAAACGGGGGDDDGGDDGGSSSSDGGSSLTALLASNPGKALDKSAAAFEDDVHSMQGKFVFKMSGGGFNADVSGDFSYRAPDAVYMTMHMASPETDALSVLGEMNFEILMLGDKLYMNTPFFGGWVVMSMDEIGVDAAQYEKLLSNHAPFSYDGLIEGLDGVDNLGNEQIEGQTYVHLRLETDFQKAMSALSESIETTGFDPSTLPIDTLKGPLVFDLWVSPDTGLPYRIQAVGNMDVPKGAADTGAALGGPMRFEMRFDFNSFNVNVEIPAAPVNAKSFIELFGGGNSGN